MLPIQFHFLSVFLGSEIIDVCSVFYKITLCLIVVVFLWLFPLALSLSLVISFRFVSVCFDPKELLSSRDRIRILFGLQWDQSICQEWIHFLYAKIKHMDHAPLVKVKYYIIYAVNGLTCGGGEKSTKREYKCFVDLGRVCQYTQLMVVTYLKGWNYKWQRLIASFCHTLVRFGNFNLIWSHSWTREMDLFSHTVPLHGSRRLSIADIFRMSIKNYTKIKSNTIEWNQIAVCVCAWRCEINFNATLGSIILTQRT